MPFLQKTPNILAKYPVEYQGTTGLDLATISGRTSIPTTTPTKADFGSGASSAPILALRVDPGALFEVVAEVGHTASADGKFFRVVIVGVVKVPTGSQGYVFNPTAAQYRRRILGQLTFVGGSTSANTIPLLSPNTAANVTSSTLCDGCTVDADYTINDSIRVSSEGADGQCIVTGDYGQHEYLEFYCSCIDTLGAASASAGTIEVRTL